MSCVKRRKTHVFIILTSRSFRTNSPFALSSQCPRPNLWESWQSKFFWFLRRKERISELAFGCVYVCVNLLPPSETPVFVWVRLSPRLHESETPYSKIQICLATVMKTQRFAFRFPQWERALRGILSPRQRLCPRNLKSSTCLCLHFF